MREPPLLEVSAPMKIAGDVHGQYSDVLRLFRGPSSGTCGAEMLREA